MTEPSKNIEIKFSYKPVPTIKKFANCNAFIRGLMGPFGCLPGDTEFLSPRGWVRIDEYAGEDVAQWHRDTNTIEFVRPSQHVKVPSPGFWKFSHSHFSMVVSDEHRVPVLDYRGVFQVKTGASLAKTPSKNTLITVFRGHNNDALGMSDDLIRFAVMMHADGHYPKRSKKAVVTVRKERKKERIRWLLANLGLEFSESVSPGRPTETRFSFYPPYVGKHYAGVWWRASQRELSIVLDEMSYWDGLHDHEEVVFTTTSENDANFIQYAAHANGRRAGIHRVVYKNKKWADGFFVRVRTGDNVHNKVQIRDSIKIDRVESEDGFQYCFTVPTSFFVARYRGSVFVTGNSGKSSGCVVEIINRSLAQVPGPDGIRRTRWSVIRGTYRMLSDTTIKTFMQWFPPQHFGEFKYSDNRYIIKAFENVEIEILFRALDRSDHIANLLSMELTGAWVNEARETPWGIIEALQGRVGRYPARREGGCTWSGIILDTNPPDSDSRWYKFFEETQHDPNFAQIFKQPSGLSPEAENLINLPEGYYDRLAQGKDPEWVKVYVAGLYGYIQDGRVVYPEYKDAAHCAEVKFMSYEPIYRGWDFGLTPSCVLCQLSPQGQLIVLDEMVSEEMGVDKFSDEVTEFCSRVYKDAEFIDIGDPAGEQRAQTDEKTCFQILHSKGILIEAGAKTLQLRLESVRKPLTRLVMGKPGFQIHPRCKILRKGFMGGYHFRRLQTSAERYTETPDKNSYSHPHDALQYVCTRLFGGGLTSTRLPPGSEAAAREFDDFQNAPGRSDVTGY